MTRKSIPIVSSTLFLLILLFTAYTESAWAITWSVKVTRLTTWPMFDGSPSITQLSNGMLLVVWSKDNSGMYKLFYMISTDRGTTWSEEFNLTAVDDPSHDSKPSIIQAGNGTIWVVWTSSPLPPPPPPPPPEPDFDIESDPGSLSIEQGDSNNSTIIITSINGFNDQVNLTVSGEPEGVVCTLNPSNVTPPAFGTANSTLTVSVGATATPGNYPLTVFGESGLLEHFHRIRLEVTSASGSSLYLWPSLTSEASDDAKDNDIYYKVSHDNGCTWSKPFPLTTDANQDLSPSIVELTNSTIMVTWQTNRTGNYEIFYRNTSDGGASWSNPEQLTTDPDADKGPTVIQTRDGNIHVCWTSLRTGDWEIYYKVYSEQSWSDDRRLTNSTNNDVAPSLLETIDGTIYLFWATSVPPTGDNDIYYKHSSDGGVTWSESTQFTTENYEDLWPSTTELGDTKIVVVWTSDGGEGNWDLYCRTSLAGDINENGIVDIWDLSIASMSYGYFEWEPEYNPDADLNKDGVVDMRDLTIIALNYGAT